MPLKYGLLLIHWSSFTSAYSYRNLENFNDQKNVFYGDKFLWPDQYCNPGAASVCFFCWEESVVKGTQTFRFLFLNKTSQKPVDMTGPHRVRAPQCPSARISLQPVEIKERQEGCSKTHNVMHTTKHYTTIQRSTQQYNTNLHNNTNTQNTTIQ